MNFRHGDHVTPEILLLLVWPDNHNRRATLNSRLKLLIRQ